jgi:hypothetical protein
MTNGLLEQEVGETVTPASRVSLQADHALGGACDRRLALVTVATQDTPVTAGVRIPSANSSCSDALVTVSSQNVPFFVAFW